MTKELLQQCLPHATKANVEKYCGKLNDAMDVYFINTPRRQAHFIAQLSQESGSLKYVEEIASGEAYEGRKDLGNTEPGDGKRYKGRGLLQITGRANYAMLSKELKYDFVANPEALTKPGPACFSAAWFWWSRHLNRYADIDAIETITKRINGGLTHFEQRKAAFEICKVALKLESKNIDTPQNIAP